jgi:DNA-binding NarL/FixJ family response regulator
VLRIALIDGDIAIRAGRKLMIESQSHLHLIFEESDAQLALEKIPDLLVDVLVIDHRLKGFDGLELAAKLVSGYAVKNEICPPIIVTGTYATPELVLAAIRAGATDVVTQDAPMSELLNAIQSATQHNALPDFSTFDEVLNHSEYRPIPDPVFVLRRSQLTEPQTEFLTAIGTNKSLDKVRQRLGYDEVSFRLQLESLLIALHFATPEQLYLALHDAGH